MIVLVTGSRNWVNVAAIEEALEAIDEPIDALVHGDASGADSIAAAWARRRGIEVRPYSAKWYPDGKRLDRSAGPKRNEQMLDSEKVDLVLAFPMSESSGTWDMIRRARQRGVEVRVYGQKIKERRP